MSPQTQALIEALSELEVVDAHEHLWPEEYHLQHGQDVLTLLQYALADLEVAGASPAEVQLLTAHRDGPRAPLEERWRAFRKYLPHIRHTAPIRALFIALRDIHGIEALDDATYEEASRRIQALRRPGLYDEILRRRCKIAWVLNQNPLVVRSDSFLLPIRNVADLGSLDSRPAIDELERKSGVRILSLGDLLQAVGAMCDRWQEDGTVAVKRSGTVLSNPTPEEAAAALAAVLESPMPFAAAPPLQHFVEHEVIAEAGRRGWPVCVHTGLWAGTWADFRLVHPENLIPIALRHRETRFDVYHAGVPWVSTVGIMARQAPNLWLNLCWTHVISPVLARRALDEWLDAVPANKLIAWGGDYWMALEKVYGHLVMARENIAEVLADRIARGLMSEAEALGVAGRTFRDNPAALYNLPPAVGPSTS